MESLNRTELKSICSFYADGSDIDGILSITFYITTLSKTFNVIDIILIAVLSRPYRNESPKYEKIMEKIKNDLPANSTLRQRNEIFDQYCGSGPTYAYGTIDDTETRMKSLVSYYRELLNILAEKLNVQINSYIFSKNERGDYFTNINNAFGAIWCPEYKIMANYETKEALAMTDNIELLQTLDLSTYNSVWIINDGSSVVLSMSNIFRNFLKKAFSNINCHVVIMGGVDAATPTQTMQIPGIRRAPKATMNQVYDPAGFTIFLQLLRDTNTSPIVVTNNRTSEIGDFIKVPYGDFRKRVYEFLKVEPGSALEMHLDTVFGFYRAQYKCKLFDVVTAVLALGIVDAKANGSLDAYYEAEMVASPINGVTIVGEHNIIVDEFVKDGNELSSAITIIVILPSPDFVAANHFLKIT